MYCSTIREPYSSFHSQTRSTKASRPSSWRVLPSAISAFLDHRLGGDASVVGAEDPERVAAAHPVHPHQRVLHRAVQRVAHVEDAGDVGRRDRDREVFRRRAGRLGMEVAHHPSIRRRPAPRSPPVRSGWSARAGCAWRRPCPASLDIEPRSQLPPAARGDLDRSRDLGAGEPVIAVAAAALDREERPPSAASKGAPTWSSARRRRPRPARSAAGRGRRSAPSARRRGSGQPLTPRRRGRPRPEPVGPGTSWRCSYLQGRTVVSGLGVSRSELPVWWRSSTSSSPTTRRWRAILWLNVPLVVVAFGGGVATLPEGSTAKGARPDIAGQVLGTAASAHRQPWVGSRWQSWRLAGFSRPRGTRCDPSSTSVGPAPGVLRPRMQVRDCSRSASICSKGKGPPLEAGLALVPLVSPSPP